MRAKQPDGTGPRKGDTVMEGSNMFIRAMQPQEISTAARIYIETVKATHTGIVSEQFLQTVSYESTFQRLESIFNQKEHRPFGYVCDDHRTVVGFVVGDVATNPPEGYQGELKMIYVLPAYHRTGIGRNLLRAAALHFERERVASMFLGVFTNNFPARRFYEAVGGRKIDEPFVENGREGFVRYGWPSVHELIQVLESSEKQPSSDEKN
jgi:ribosomal protein S18 acetylase RimI-like enzyme